MLKQDFMKKLEIDLSFKGQSLDKGENKKCFPSEKPGR